MLFWDHASQPRNFSRQPKGGDEGLGLARSSPIAVFLYLSQSRRISPPPYSLRALPTMVTGKSHPGVDSMHRLPPTAAHPEAIATSPPSKRDLASWWRQFKRNTRKEEPKGMCGGILGLVGSGALRGFGRVAIVGMSLPRSHQNCPSTVQDLPELLLQPSLSRQYLYAQYTDEQQKNPKASSASPSTSALNTPTSPSLSLTITARASSTDTFPLWSRNVECF